MDPSGAPVPVHPAPGRSPCANEDSSGVKLDLGHVRCSPLQRVAAGVLLLNLLPSEATHYV